MKSTINTCWSSSKRNEVHTQMLVHQGDSQYFTEHALHSCFECLSPTQSQQVLHAPRLRVGLGALPCHPLSCALCAASQSHQICYYPQFDGLLARDTEIAAQAAAALLDQPPALSAADTAPAVPHSAMLER